MKELNIYDTALKHYGIKHQLLMVMEECAELSKECSKVYRALEDGDIFTLDRLAEEIADVQITSGQVSWFFNLKDKVKTERKSKLRRLAERIEHENDESKADISGTRVREFP